MSDEEQREQYLLEQYAGQAMRGMLAHPLGSPGSPSFLESTVVKSWDYAERMVEERNKRMKKAATKSDGLSGEQEVTN